MKGARVRGVRQPIGAGQVVGNPNTAGTARPQVLSGGDLARTIQAAGVGRPGAVGANPTAIISDVVVNGTALTFMRSDAAPPAQKASSSRFGIVEVDGVTIVAVGGIISAVGAGAGRSLLPLVTGALPGPDPVADGFGQYIGVPV